MYLRRRDYVEIEEGLFAGHGCIDVDVAVDVIVSLDCSCPARAPGADRVCYDILNGHVIPWENLVGAILTLLTVRARGGRVYVHCMAGCGRTGTVVSAYLMLSRGWSAEEAVGYFVSRRGCGPETWEQHRFLRALDVVLARLGREGAVRALQEAGGFEEFLGLAERLGGGDS